MTLKVTQDIKDIDLNKTDDNDPIVMIPPQMFDSFNPSNNNHSSQGPTSESENPQTSDEEEYEEDTEDNLSDSQKSPNDAQSHSTSNSSSII